MCYNRFTIQIDLFKYKRIKDGGCAYKNTGSSHLKLSTLYFALFYDCVNVRCQTCVSGNQS